MNTNSSYTAKISIAPKANTKVGSLTFFTVPIVLLLLAIPFPFFRHIFTFASFIVTIIAALSCYAAYEDMRNGVKRNRPAKGFTMPKWFKHAFFIFIIAVSAGLRLGWYLVSILWVINWVCLVSAHSHVKATYLPKEDNNA